MNQVHIIFMCISTKELYLATDGPQRIVTSQELIVSKFCNQFYEVIIELTNQWWQLCNSHCLLMQIRSCSVNGDQSETSVKVNISF